MQAPIAPDKNPFPYLSKVIEKVHHEELGLSNYITRLSEDDLLPLLKEVTSEIENSAFRIQDKKKFQRLIELIAFNPEEEKIIKADIYEKIGRVFKNFITVGLGFFLAILGFHAQLLFIFLLLIGSGAALSIFGGIASYFPSRMKNQEEIYTYKLRKLELTMLNEMNRRHYQQLIHHLQNCLQTITQQAISLEENQPHFLARMMQTVTQAIEQDNYWQGKISVQLACNKLNQFINTHSIKVLDDAEKQKNHSVAYQLQHRPVTSAQHWESHKGEIIQNTIHDSMTGVSIFAISGTLMTLFSLLGLGSVASLLGGPIGLGIFWGVSAVVIITLVGINFYTQYKAAQRTHALNKIEAASKEQNEIRHKLIKTNNKIENLQHALEKSRRAQHAINKKIQNDITLNVEKATHTAITELREETHIDEVKAIAEQAIQNVQQETQTAIETVSELHEKTQKIQEELEKSLAEATDDHLPAGPAIEEISITTQTKNSNTSINYNFFSTAVPDDQGDVPREKILHCLSRSADYSPLFFPSSQTTNRFSTEMIKQQKITSLFLEEPTFIEENRSLSTKSLPALTVAES